MHLTVVRRCVERADGVRGRSPEVLGVDDKTRDPISALAVRGEISVLVLLCTLQGGPESVCELVEVRFGKCALQRVAGDFFALSLSSAPQRKLLLGPKGNYKIV